MTADFKGRRILVVEDEQPVRSLVLLALANRGYRVLSAASGSQALALLDAEKPPLDLLLTDANMPGMSGIDLVRRLLAERPSLPVIVMSGYTEDTIVHHGVLRSGISFLHKPFTLDALARKLHEALDDFMDPKSASRRKSWSTFPSL